MDISYLWSRRRAVFPISSWIISWENKALFIPSPFPPHPSFLLFEQTPEQSTSLPAPVTAHAVSSPWNTPPRLFLSGKLLHCHL